MNLIGLIHLLTVLILSASAQKCVNDGSFNVVCSDIVDKFPPLDNLNLSHFSYIIPIVELKCVNCRIPVVHEDTIGHFGGHSFDISNSSVKTISEGAFKTFSADTVKSFYFQQNDISWIGLGVFKRFSELEQLQLQKNNLSVLFQKQFEDVSVKTLDISQNHIRDIGNNALSGLTLQVFNVSHNQLEVVDSNTFAKVTFTSRFRHMFMILKESSFVRWSELHLSNNQIKLIGKSAFAHQGKLDVLYLNNNKLSQIEPGAFEGLSDIEWLYLNNNSIASLSQNTFENLKNTSILDLSSNQIETIPQGLFKSLQALKNLKLNNNRIKTVNPTSFSGLISLNKLDISYNRLRQLRETDLFMLGRITDLNLAGNRLETLNIIEILKHNRELTKINVNDNFWSCASLMMIYKAIISQNRELSGASDHYTVPNLHGIACTRSQIDIYDDTTFQHFLDVISRDTQHEDLYDVRFIDDGAEHTQNSLDYLRKIYYLVLVIAVVGLSVISVLFLMCFISVCLKNSVSTGFNFFYRVHDDKIELINQA